MGTAIILNGILLFGVLYLAPFGLDDMSFADYLVFALTWVGFGIMVNAIYIHFELLCKGRMYMIQTMIVILCTTILALIITAFDGNFVLYSIECSKQYGFASPLMWGAFILGFIMIGTIGKITRYKLDQRSFVK
ncbi:hypothetical protein D3C81_1390140 [compost metagenome]